MADSMATVVDWYGPYKQKDCRSAVVVAQAKAQADFGRGLYVAIGHLNQNLPAGPRTILYVGISENLGIRVSPNHEVLGTLSISSIWLGEIATAGIPGPRVKRTNPNLDIVEWMTAYFLRTPKNERKMVAPPPMSAVVLNRWWATDYEKVAERPVARWADVIEWDAYKETANLCWFGRTGKVLGLDRNASKIRRHPIK